MIYYVNTEKRQLFNMEVCVWLQYSNNVQKMAKSRVFILRQFVFQKVIKHPGTGSVSLCFVPTDGTAF